MNSMMDNINFSIRGFYKMGLLNMYIDGHISPDISTLNKKDQGTFVHEYIHYLQNLTTLSGLRFSSYYIDYIIRLVKWLKEVDEVRVPINVEDVLTEGSLKDNFLFFNILSGTIKQFSFDIEQDIYWRFEWHDKNEVIYLKIKDIAGEYQDVLLGVYAIKESMAALYQSLINGDNTLLYDYPYNSVRYLVYHLFPSLVDDTKKLICICQIALDSPSPARDLLKWLLTASENPEKNGIELYEMHLQENYFTYWEKTNEELKKNSVKDLLNYSIDSYLSKLDKILLHKNKNYANTLTTIKLYIDIHLRILYADGDLISNIKLMMDVCGIPFIYNDYGERMHPATLDKEQLETVPIDDDILFILSLCNLCTSLILPTNACNCRCIFRTMFCNLQLSQDELDEHVFCFDQPWKEKGCNYWKILNMLNIEHEKINLRTKTL